MNDLSRIPPPPQGLPAKVVNRFVSGSVREEDIECRYRLPDPWKRRLFFARFFWSTTAIMISDWLQCLVDGNVEGLPRLRCGTTLRVRL
jgi:hypothetical protein